MAKKTDEKEENFNEILGDYLKEHKEDHLNFIEEVNYHASTGSLIFDLSTGGGMPPGLHRLIGPPESGKSSAALEMCRGFLAKHPQGRGLYIKAEGKLPHEMRKRCGLKFVWNYEEWEDGTIFVLESNHYEFIINLLRRLVIVTETKHLLCIIFDSMDGLILGGDVKKESGEGHKVAGAPLLTAQFLQKMGNEMGRRGHMCLMLSQYSTNISINPYSAPEDKRCRQGGGGWKVAHYAHFVFDFGDSFNQDLIKEDQKLPPSQTNKILGKRVNIKFKKSPNEKTGIQISYPIQYGVIGKSSIWSAFELVDVLKMCSMITVGKTWVDFPAKLVSDAKLEGIEIPDKFNGERKMINWFDSNQKAADFVIDKLRNTVKGLIEGGEHFNEAQEA